MVFRWGVWVVVVVALDVVVAVVTFSSGVRVNGIVTVDDDSGPTYESVVSSAV